MDRSRSRAQLILVAGVGIAVTFVALALILNTVVYTENLATRQGVDGQDAIVFERAAEDGVGGLVSQLNYYDYESYAGLHRSLDGSVAAWENESSWSEASRGTAVSVGVTRATNGSHIVQRGPNRSFTTDSGSPDWTLVNDSTGTRRFRMDVLQNSLGAPGASPFRILVTNSSSAWTIEIRQNATNAEDVTVEVESQLCTRGTGADDRVSVDLSGGTVNGTECDPLTTIPWENVTSIEYVNGDSVQGRYTLFVDEPYGSLDKGPYSGIVGDDPYVVRAIYDATLNLSVQSEKLSYTSTVEIAPERPAGGETYEVYQESRELVYVSVSTNLLSSVHPDGTITRYNASGVKAIGPKQANFDDDPLLEVPYVDSSNNLVLIDANNETQEIATSVYLHDDYGTILGVGEWSGSKSVFYVNSTDGNLWRATPGTGTSEIRVNSESVPAKTALGVANFDGQSGSDLVYVGSVSTSYAVRYIAGSATHSTGTAVGRNNGVGAGAPRIFDSSSPARTPIVDGSGNIALLTHEGSETDLTSSGPAEKSPIAGTNWVGGPAKEVVFIGSSQDTLHYVTLGGSIEAVQTENGTVKADPDVGVA